VRCIQEGEKERELTSHWHGMSIHGREHAERLPVRAARLLQRVDAHGKQLSARSGAEEGARSASAGATQGTAAHGRGRARGQVAGQHGASHAANEGRTCEKFA
jgi:hypothetical protein